MTLPAPETRGSVKRGNDDGPEDIVAAGAERVACACGWMRQSVGACIAPNNSLVAGASNSQRDTSAYLKRATCNPHGAAPRQRAGRAYR